MRFVLYILLSFFLFGCTNQFNKILKSHDPEYKLRMAEQFYVKKMYSKAQQVYEDIMPYFKTTNEFEDIYYKYAYCAWYQRDYQNAEDLFKNYLEIFPNSNRAEEIDFMHANCFYKQSPKPELDQTNTIKAMGMMQTFINTHPGSPRNKDANAIIEICRNKLETKEYQSAVLYFDIGQFRAAGVAFTELLNDYPESPKGDEYKLMIIKAYFKFAEMSYDEKKRERFEKVINECNDFVDRFPESKLRKESDHFLSLSQTNIKNLNITNE